MENLVETHRMKGCKCKAKFSADRLVCLECGKNKDSKPLSEAAKPAAGRVVLTESQRPDLAHLTEVQKKRMIALEADFALFQTQKQMVESYKGLGLTHKEACIAAGIEKSISTKIDENFSF